jgi:hypothetical protein
VSVAVREFTDSSGKSWRTWDVTPESIRPLTRAEDYLADCFQVGWLVFETTSGTEKRRLCPYPVRWSECTDDDLRELLGRAESVPPLKLHAERQIIGPVTSDGAPPVEVPSARYRFDVTDLQVVRTFHYPGGESWTVCMITHPDDGGAPTLRFTAGERAIDLRTWPKAWPDYPDERLVELLRRAAPRRRMTRPPEAGAPRRRWNDEPVAPAS